jgi:hypothetical protein
MPQLRVAALAATIAAFSLGFSSARGAELSVSEWIDDFVGLCVGSGSSTIASGTADGGVGITLKTFSLDGQLKGQIVLSKTQNRLLVDGITSKLSTETSQFADKVRDCLAPVRRVLLSVMSSQFSSSGSGRIEILSPDEEKIIQVLASTNGQTGETGKDVPIRQIKQATGLGDIRMRSAFGSLQQKFFMITMEHVGPPPTAEVMMAASLLPSGDDYAQTMGYAQ